MKVRLDPASKRILVALLASPKTPGEVSRIYGIPVARLGKAPTTPGTRTRAHGSHLRRLGGRDASVFRSHAADRYLGGRRRRGTVALPLRPLSFVLMRRRG